MSESTEQDISSSPRENASASSIQDDGLVAAALRGNEASYKKLVDDYQKAAPVMGQREAAEKAEKIALLEQEIMMLEKTLTDQVSKELLDLQKNYLIDTYNYMQKIGTELGYDYVLNYQIGGPIYSCASKNDITKTVIESLNKAYNEASK